MIIAHRQNNITVESAVEIDIRYAANELVVSHDLRDADCLSFRDWLEKFKGDFVLINVKEEGLEDLINEELSSYRSIEWVILDETVPFIYKYCKKGMSNFMLRTSRYESAASFLNWKRDLGPHCPEWVWVDTFGAKIPSIADLKMIHDLEFKICIVSPELHGYGWSEVYAFATESANEIHSYSAAVCTKYSSLWEGFWNSTK